MSSSLEETWETVAPNPDPADDMGYVYDLLSVIHVKEGGEKYIFLPGEEDHLTDSEFMIADPSSIRSLDDCR
jgi:hypothetical protein